MALNIDTQDLINYPGTTKRVTIDVTSIVPTGYEGDEKIVMTAATTAYSDNVLRTAIQDLYITEMKAGWCKSSGFTGTNGKYSITDSQKNIMVMMDNTVSGTDGLGYYQVTLDTSDTLINGDVIAADLETKIRALTMETADTGFALAYRNASVEYQDGKFYIITGSVSEYYTGTNRSSVKVKAASSADCSVELGFNVSMDSQTMAGIAPKDTYLSSDYISGAGTVSVVGGSNVSQGDACMIKDADNTVYFTALSGTIDTSIAVATYSTNGYHGIPYGFTVSGTKVQVLRESDPDGGPTMWYTNVDSIGRWAIKTLVNQVDYSS